MIETNGNGTYTVHFFGTNPVTIEKPSLAEISAFNTDAGDGLWLPVLVKAYGRYKLDHKSTPVPEDPLEAVAIHGGLTSPIIALLTNHGTSSHRPSQFEGELRKKLADSFSNNRIVIVHAKGHAMTGISYDRGSDEITVWNPWGNTGNFKKWNVKMKNGYFTMPIAELVEKSPGITFEEPHVPPGKVKTDHRSSNNRVVSGAKRGIWEAR
jgi:hypothetical protein